MTAGRIALPDRPRILVIALRRLGDVLLTTPLIRSLRRAYPNATIEALVFADTASILAGNPDLNAVVTMPPRPSMVQTVSLAARLFRRYDLAVSTQTGDRPTGFAILAGRARVAPVEDRASGKIKNALLQRSQPVSTGVHRVEEMLRLADLLGIPRVGELVPPRAQDLADAPGGAYAVIHAMPMYRYKQWTQQGWRDLAAALEARGLWVIATGSPAPAERRYLDEVWNGSSVPVLRLDGRINWRQLSGLLAKARLFVGPDTSVTHLAAASGCPTVALYGPTDPRLWAPWPAAGLDIGWGATGKVQRRGNVWVVQNTLPCTPCQLEGCDRRIESNSVCLDELTSAQVMGAIDQALAVEKR